MYASMIGVIIYDCVVNDMCVCVIVKRLCESDQNKYRAVLAVAHSRVHLASPNRSEASQHCLLEAA